MEKNSEPIVERKYEFKGTGIDTVKLVYKDKEFEFKRNVDLSKRLQSINVNARKKMIFDLAKDGKTIKDLTIEIKKNDKTYYDNSNVKALEEIYVAEDTSSLFDELSIKLFNMSLEELFEDIGIETEDEVVKFSEDFSRALISKKEQIPSGR